MTTDFGAHAHHKQFHFGCTFCRENVNVSGSIDNENIARILAEELPDLHENCPSLNELQGALNEGFEAGLKEGRNDLRDEINELLLVEARPRKTFDSLEEANEFLSELHKLLKEKR